MLYSGPVNRTLIRNIITRNLKVAKFSTFLTLRNTASASATASKATVTTPKKGRNPWVAATLGLGTGALLYAWLRRQKEEDIKYFEVDENINAFPNILRPPLYPFDVSFSLLGLGVRSVTIATFKVYALGIYIADADKKLVPKILNSNFLKSTFIDTDSTKTHNENVKAALDDPQKSTVLARNLLDGGVRMAAKFTPIKNTNLTFVREGIIKTLLNHPNAEENKDLLDKGIEELRNSFNKKGSFLKDDDLLMELKSDGSLQLTYMDNKHGEIYPMNIVKEPMIGRFLFSQYMSGPKPLSAACKDQITKTLVDLV